MTRIYLYAIWDYDRAIVLEPGNVEHYLSRGDIHQHLEQHNEAILDYEKALALEPEHSEAYFKRGFSFRSLARVHIGHRQTLTWPLRSTGEVRHTLAVVMHGTIVAAFATAGLEEFGNALEDFNVAVRLHP